MITVSVKGDFKKTRKFLEKPISRNKIIKILNKYGEMGVQALVSATPVTTGRTAGAWDYIIETNGNNYSLIWTNAHVEKGVNIALILQTGHATGTGGYVRGVDYINPALKPIFDDISKNVLKEVTED